MPCRECPNGKWRWGNGPCEYESKQACEDANAHKEDKMKLNTARPRAKLRSGRNDWYRIENKADSDEAEIYIYDEIGYFGITAKDFVNELRELDTDKIMLHLNTPGGDVFDGIAIYNALKDHKANVTVQVDAAALSAGSFIAQAGDKAVMTKNATMMIHSAHGLTIGNADDMREMAELLDKTTQNIASIYADRSGRDIDDFLTAMKAETWYNAEEAVEAGLADEVKGSTSEKDAKDSWDLSIYSYAGRSEAPAPVIPQKDEGSYDPDVLREALKEALSA